MFIRPVLEIELSYLQTLARANECSACVTIFFLFMRNEDKVSLIFQ